MEKEKLLIIDDSILQAHTLKKILENDYEVASCPGGREGIEKARIWQPSLILLDVIMPVMDGFEVLGKLLESDLTKDIPVILITSLSDVGNEEKGLTMGAVDYIVKPFNASIVKARVKTHTQLYKYRKTIENLALLDGLTGIANRRFYDGRKQSEWYRAVQTGAPLSIGLMDIDYFKQYNDRYGHQGGDEVLRRVAEILLLELSPHNGFGARYGGEEFVFLIADCPPEKGREIAHSICRRIESLQIPHELSEASRYVTASIGGLTVVPWEGEEYDAYFKTVDSLLYRAKEQGRNSVLWTKCHI